jgi:hypothetical protein
VENLDGVPDVSRRRAPTGPVVAAIVAGIFTLIGAVFGVVLDRTLDLRIRREIWRRDMALRLVERSMGRWTRARTVLMAADSSVYAARWDDYIQQGFTRWNEEYLVLQFGVMRCFPGAKADFDELQHQLAVLHETLLLYHRSGGSPPQEVRRTAERQLEASGAQVRKFAALVLDAVE